MNDKAKPFLPPHGGYKKLISYQKSEIIFDATVFFANKYYRKGDRTIDQMVQAARSGKQNIAEGSQASAGSKEIELRLTIVARSSLEELLIDYYDFLRINGLNEWAKDHPYAVRLRELNREKNATYALFKRGIEHQNREISANVIIGLIKVTCYLLDRQISRMQKDFVTKGGIKETMTQARLDYRRNEKDKRT